MGRSEVRERRQQDLDRQLSWIVDLAHIPVCTARAGQWPELPAALSALGTPVLLATELPPDHPAYEACVQAQEPGAVVKSTVLSALGASVTFRSPAFVTGCDSIQVNGEWQACGLVGRTATPAGLTHEGAITVNCPDPSGAAIGGASVAPPDGVAWVLVLHERWAHAYPVKDGAVRFLTGADLLGAKLEADLLFLRGDGTVAGRTDSRAALPADGVRRPGLVVWHAIAVTYFVQAAWGVARSW